MGLAGSSAAEARHTPTQTGRLAGRQLSGGRPVKGMGRRTLLPRRRHTGDAVQQSEIVAEPRLHESRRARKNPADAVHDDPGQGAHESAVEDERANLHRNGCRRTLPGLYLGNRGTAPQKVRF